MTMAMIILLNLLKDQQIRNMKNKIVSEMNPVGHSFEAVAELKSKLIKQGKDKFFIYKLNDGKMNGSTSYVFKTSGCLLKLALSMDKESKSLLSKEWAYFDGTLMSKLLLFHVMCM